MRLTIRLLLGVLLASAVALSGCGGTESAVTVPKIAFASSAIEGAAIPARYTCDGRDTTPPLEWGKVPVGTASLALFVVGVVPEPATKTFALSVEWAVAGLNPALHKLRPGEVPPGAFVGTASNGKRRYSICPKKKGQIEQYQFELYGLPDTASISRDFAGLPVLAKLAGSKSSPTPASGHGAFIVTYRRA